MASLTRIGIFRTMAEAKRQAQRVANATGQRVVLVKRKRRNPRGLSRARLAAIPGEMAATRARWAATDKGRAAAKRRAKAAARRLGLSPAYGGQRVEDWGTPVQNARVMQQAEDARAGSSTAPRTRPSGPRSSTARPPGTIAASAWPPVI